MAQQQLRILTISAHPHDWTWFAGTLGIHVEMGDQATVCIVTHGGRTHREAYLDELRKPEAERNPEVLNVPIEKYTEQKEEEMRRDAAIFGVTDVRMLGYPDKPFLLQEHPQAIEDLTELILDVQPHVLITECPFTDTARKMAHRTDHTEVGRAAMEAKERAQRPRDSLVSPHRIAVTFWPGDQFSHDELDFVVELSDKWFEKRVEAEACYESQGHDESWSRRRMIVDLGKVGWAVKTNYAEGYVREHPELLTSLPVPQPMIEQAAEGSMERIRRLSQ